MQIKFLNFPAILLKMNLNRLYINSNPFLSGIASYNFAQLKEYFKKKIKVGRNQIINISSISTKECIKTILILNLKEERTKVPKFAEALFHLLPKEIFNENVNSSFIDQTLIF